MGDVKMESLPLLRSLRYWRDESLESDMREKMVIEVVLPSNT